jgi:hypothetical protein
MSGHRKQIIPLCRSEFLQDFSIELGRRLKSIGHQSQAVLAEVRFVEQEGRELEALSVWIKTSVNTRATISLWENQTIWICVELLPTKNNKKFQLDFHPSDKEFSAAAIVDALRDTMLVSARLCDNESPLPALRRIWRHKGQVNTRGSLQKTRSTASKENS